MTFDEAATVPIGGLTALGFMKKARVSNNQEVLIYGASGSVGVFAIQIARHFGANVTSVCSGVNIELVKSLGASRTIDYMKEDFKKSGLLFDVVFDAVGKTSKSVCKKLLKPHGKYISVTGSPPREPGDMQYLKELIEAETIRTVIDRTYPLEQIRDAHAYVEKFHKRGNVAVKVIKDDNIGD